MPGLNLTRDEARERAGLVHVDRYDVDLDLTVPSTTVFRSRTRVVFDAEAGASTFIDAVTERVHTITLNGAELDPALVSDGLRIQLPDLTEHNELVIDADARYSITGEGLHRFVDPVDDEVYLYTQFEVPDARRMYAVFEQPDLKASFTFTVTAPESWTVVANTPVAETAPAPDAAQGPARVWRFQPTQRISSYITALVAGPYHHEHGELTSVDGRTIPLGVYCRRSLAEHLDADYIMAKTRQGFAFYERLWDVPYPFEKYDQLFVPEFNAGAMENAGAVTFTEAYVFRSNVPDAMRERRVVTILHELAHMWFGDLVTMRWWNDLWLNESFAEFTSTLATAEATEWKDAWATFASTEKAWAYRQDQLPSTHPILAPIRDIEDVQVNFDGITYAKGASVLKQLVAYVGRDAFFRGIHRYLTTHAHGNAELADLFSELEAASGRDLRTWSRLWLETAGVDTLTGVVETDDDGVITAFRIEQTAPEEHPVLRPHRLAIGVYQLTGSGLERVDRIEIDVDGASTDVPALVGTRRPDLILVNDDDLTYAKVRLDPASERAAIAHLKDLHDPTARAIVWSALWDATRDCEIPAHVFTRTVLANVHVEDESTTLRTVLAQLGTVTGVYAAPDTRARARHAAADVVWQLAQNAPAGSDRQFQFVRSFAALASTPEQFDIVEALRDGRLTLPALVIDTDLAWDLLVSLVVGGRAGVPEIDAALEQDHTATGMLAAARARAAIPTSENKLETARRILTDDSLTNLTVRHMGFGLQRVLDPELLRGIIEPHFAALEPLWHERSYHMVEEIIDATFPAGLADEALADRARAWLADHERAPQALRRIVIENLAGVLRALDVQRRDAQDA